MQFRTMDSSSSAYRAKASLQMEHNKSITTNIYVGDIFQTIEKL